MELKELRTSKNLSQSECAKYLGISLRSYQSYENEDNKKDSLKYKDMLSKLNQYTKENPEIDFAVAEFPFQTTVVVGEGINAFKRRVEKFKKRDCFCDLQKYIYRDFDGKICVLYGLRRTGKTTMLFQMMAELALEKVAYIKIKTTDNMAKLSKDLQLLYQNGYKYIFIDEVTLMDDFINTAAILSDVYASMEMKIVVSGTDSLGFVVADRDELYDRNVMIHTSFIPFREYERLLGICSIDQYIEYGGTLKMENMGFDDPDSKFDEVSFRDEESTRKYIDTAIARNIQHTLKNDKDGEYFNELRELYEKKELTNVINRIVENLNHRFLLEAVEEKFKSHDYGSAKELLLHEAPKKTAYILYEVDQRKIVERLKQIIDIKEKDETSVQLSQTHIQKIKRYLAMLDLIFNCPDIYESGIEEEHYLFAQPGMRYSIAKALAYALMQDESFRSYAIEERQHIIEKILEDVKGKMLEEIVLLETAKSIPNSQKAFKYKFDKGGKFDMVIYDSKSNCCSLYEIKHGDKAVEKQARSLLDEIKCKAVEHTYGKIKGKYVLYRGEDTEIGEIHYRNVEEYLKQL